MYYPDYFNATLKNRFVGFERVHFLPEIKIGEKRCYCFCVHETYQNFQKRTFGLQEMKFDRDESDYVYHSAVKIISERKIQKILKHYKVNRGPELITVFNQDCRPLNAGPKYDLIAGIEKYVLSDLNEMYNKQNRKSTYFEFGIGEATSLFFSHHIQNEKNLRSMCLVIDEKEKYNDYNVNQKFRVVRQDYYIRIVDPGHFEFVFSDTAMEYNQDNIKDLFEEFEYHLKNQEILKALLKNALKTLKFEIPGDRF